VRSQRCWLSASRRDKISKLRRKAVDEIATRERFDGPAYTLADQPRGNPDGRETRGTG
jgi:hypothetical protein